MSIELPQYYAAKPNDQKPAFPDPYSQPLANPQTTPFQNYGNENDTEQPKQLSPFIYYIISCALFLGAIGINLGMWAIDRYAVSYTQASNYYSKAYPVSTSLNGSTFTDSTYIYSSTPNSATSVALSLIYSWVLWKFALIVFTYNLSENEESMIKKLVLVGIQLLIMLAIDILGTIFLSSIYNDYIFYGIYTILCIAIAFINNMGREKGKEALLNSIIPLFLIAFYFTCYCLFLPSLYRVYYTNLGSYGAAFLVIYLYPFFDLLFYGILLFLGTFVENNCKNFHGTIHFLQIGYAVGMIMMAGYTQVQFYYLLGYFIFRNVFVNWIMRKWERIVCNPPALPGWVIAYYLSYLLNFLPIIGVGKLVLSMGFSSQIFSKTSPILYQNANPLYPSSSWLLTSINSSFAGNIFWLCGAIIWVGLTFTQQYERRRPQWTDIFYYLLGIHFFYFGISCSLSINYMVQTSSSVL